MLIDMHIHEKTYSKDSFIGLDEIIDRAIEVGLDGVCITDHDSLGLLGTARHVSRERRFPVFVGAEILTCDGDVLVFGVDRLPEGMMPAQELIEWIGQRGGVTIGAHPYRQNGRGMADRLFSLDRLAGIEALNGSTPAALNQKAHHAARCIRIPAFGSSDAHRLERVGKYATWFPRRISDTEELVSAIKEGNTKPVFYDQGVYREFRYHPVLHPVLHAV